MRHASYRYFSSFFRNVMMTYIIFYFKRYFLFFPFSAVQYAYMLPFGLMLHASLDYAASCRKERSPVLPSASRAVFFALSCLLLSPFLQWWMIFPDSWYFFLMAQLFALSCSFFVFGFAGILIFHLSEAGFRRTLFLAKIARLFALYGLVAPIIAFFLASLYGQSGGDDVYSLLFSLSPWRKAVLFLPVFLVCALADLARHEIEKQGFVPDDTVEEESN